MGSRERKRAELQKRKQRAAEQPVGASPETGAPAVAGPEPPVGTAEEQVSRSEMKNREARAALKPLGEGERPLVVTIGAVISGLLALSVVVAFIAGLKVNGDQPPIGQVLIPIALMGTMAWGMWRARYWAVLGFQTILLLLILAAALGLVRAAGAPQIAGNLVLLTVTGTLFYFMIKALARIQMPSSRT